MVLPFVGESRKMGGGGDMAHYNYTRTKSDKKKCLTTASCSDAVLAGLRGGIGGQNPPPPPLLEK